MNTLGVTFATDTTNPSSALKPVVSVSVTVYVPLIRKARDFFI